jgi:hypothetical protein
MIIALPATSLMLSYYRQFLRKQEVEEKAKAGTAATITKEKGT